MFMDMGAAGAAQMAYVPMSITEHINSLSLANLPYTSFETQEAGQGVRVAGDFNDLSLADHVEFLSEGSASFDGNALGMRVHEVFTLEVRTIQQLDALHARGQWFLARMYAYRQISKALPAEVAEEQRAELYAATYRALRPAILFLLDLMRFRSTLCETIARLLADLAPVYGARNLGDFDFFASPELLLAFARTFDVVLSLDFVKHIKTCFNNDLSSYKRAAQLHAKSAEIPDDLMDLQMLYFFLASSDSFVSELRKALELSMPQIERIFADMLEYAVDTLDDTRHMPMAKKHTLLKAAALLLVLLDTPPESHDKEVRKKLDKRVERAVRHIRHTPAVFAFGEAPLLLYHVLAKCKLPPLDGLKRADYDDPKPRFVGPDFAAAVQAILREHDDLALQFVVGRNEALLAFQAAHTLSPAQDAELYQLVIEMLGGLLRWGAFLNETFAYRCSKPGACGGEASATGATASGTAALYELAVQRNYTVPELLLLLRLINVVVQTQSLLVQLPVVVREALARHIQQQVVHFATNTLADVAIAANKNRRPSAALLRRLKDICLDYGGGGTGAAPPHNVPTGSQYYIVRVFLHFVSSKRARGMVGGLIRSKDFKDAELMETVQFLRATCIHEQVLALHTVANAAADLSRLWTRELYLDMCGETQFPITASLPYLLTQTALRTPHAAAAPLILVPLEIYNDAASFALQRLECQYIFDEVESETNLLMDLLAFQLAQSVYRLYKVRAASQCLDSALQDEVSRLPTAGAGGPGGSGQHRRARTASASAATAAPLLLVSASDPLPTHASGGGTVPYNWLDFVLAQKSVQVIGRTVNLSRVVASAVNQLLQINLTLIVAKFESMPLAAVMETQSLLQIAETTHALLSRHLQLVNWSQLRCGLDEQVTLAAFNGRFLTHVLVELLDEVLPNWCWSDLDHRFNKSPAAFHETPRRARAPKLSPLMAYGSKELAFAYSVRNTASSVCIDARHFDAIVSLVGEHGLSVLYGELCQHLDQLLPRVLDTLVPAFKAACCPRALLLPNLPSGFVGVYEYLKQMLRPLLEDPHLAPLYLQTFREMGNTLLILRELQHALEHSKLRTRIQTFPLLLSVDKMTQTSMLEHVTRNADALLFSSPEQLSACRWANVLARHYLAPTPNLFTAALAKLRYALSRRMAGSTDAAPDVLNDPAAFFRVWSATLFACCVLNALPGYTTRELFGDGFLWGGCAVTHMLGQTSQLRALDYTWHVLSFASDFVRSAGLGTATATASSANADGSSGKSQPEDGPAAVAGGLAGLASAEVLRGHGQLAQFFGSLTSTAAPVAQTQQAPAAASGSGIDGGVVTGPIALPGYGTLTQNVAQNLASLMRADENKRREFERFAEAALLYTSRQGSILAALEQQSAAVDEASFPLQGPDDGATTRSYAGRHAAEQSQVTFTLVGGASTSLSRNVAGNAALGDDLPPSVRSAHIRDGGPGLFGSMSSASPALFAAAPPSARGSVGPAPIPAPYHGTFQRQMYSPYWTGGQPAGPAAGSAAGSATGAPNGSSGDAPGDPFSSNSSLYRPPAAPGSL